jgi:PAS domain S-box-containing protein
MFKEVSCRITAALISYLQNRGYDHTRLYTDLPYTTDYLLNPHNWISESELVMIAERAFQMTNNVKIMYEIGRCTPLLHSKIAFQKLIKSVGTPLIAFGNVAHFSSLFNRKIGFQVDMISSDTVLISLKQSDPNLPSRHVCYYAQGVLAEIPRLWNLPPAEIHELYCACDKNSPLHEIVGNVVQDCLFEVKWQNPPTRVSKISNFIFAGRSTAHNTLSVMDKNYHLLDTQNNELVRQNNLLASVREIAVTMDSTDTFEQLLQKLIELCRNIPGVGFALMVKIDETGNSVSVLNYSKIRNSDLIAPLKTLGIDVEADPDKKLAEYLHLSPAQIKIIIRQTINHNILFFDRLSQLLDGVWTHELCDSVQKVTDFKQFVLIPLAIDEHNWVGLILSLSEKIPLDILEMLKSHTSIALKNVQSMEKLAKRNQELSAINSIAGKIVQSLDINQIVAQTVQEIRRIYSAHSVAIFIRDEATGGLRLVGQQGMPETILESSQKFAVLHPFTRLLNSEESLSCGNMREFPFQSANFDFIKTIPTSVWYVSTVITVDGRREGILTVVRYGVQDFQQDEKNLLMSLTNQLALAFQNARLHQNLLQRVKDLENTKNELSESAEKMRLTLDSLSEAITVASLDGKIIQANKAASRMHGYDRNEDFVGKSSLMYVVWEERRRMLENLKKIKETGVFRKAEYTLVKKDGSTFETECSISVYRNFLGIPEGFVICIRDISARKQTEKRLIENERRYRLIAENTNDFIALLTFGGFYSYVSPSYRQLGYEPTELINKPGLDLIHPDDKKLILPFLLKYSQMDNSDLARLKKDNASQRLEYRVKDKTGNWHSFDTTGNIVEAQDGRGYLLLFISRDVTRRKKAADELQALYAKEKSTSQALAQEINKRADFFRALVHELKTPLTPILVSSETLKDLAPDQIFQNLAGNVYHSAMRLNNRIDELLDISRGELGLLKLNLDPVNVSLLLKDIVNYIQPQVSQNQQILITQFPDNLPQINGEEMRIRQVILNLLDNAMKFTPENGKIFLEAIADEEILLVKVRDTGRGIDDIDKERIFQPYNRIESDRQHFSGLGLGLALCKQFIDLHGGKLWIESQKNQGTTFFFILPVMKSSRALPLPASMPDTTNS